MLTLDNMPYQEDTSVVVNMQKAQLLPSLLSDDKKGVHEIQHLRDVEHIQNEGQRRILFVERFTRQQSVSSGIRTHPGFNAHIRAEHDLSNVVKELQRVKPRDCRKELHDKLQGKILV